MGMWDPRRAAGKGGGGLLPEHVSANRGGGGLLAGRSVSGSGCALGNILSLARVVDAETLDYLSCRASPVRRLFTA